MKSNALRFPATLLYCDKPILVPYRSSVSQMYLKLVQAHHKTEI